MSYFREITVQDNLTVSSDMIVEGTITAPAYTFTSDSTTGLYFDTSNSMSLCLDSEDHLTINGTTNKNDLLSNLVEHLRKKNNIMHWDVDKYFPLKTSSIVFDASNYKKIQFDISGKLYYMDLEKMKQLGLLKLV